MFAHRNKYVAALSIPIRTDVIGHQTNSLNSCVNFYSLGIFSTNSQTRVLGSIRRAIKRGIDYVFADLKIYDDHLCVFQSKQLLRKKNYTNTLWRYDQSSSSFKLEKSSRSETQSPSEIGLDDDDDIVKPSGQTDVCFA